MLAATEFDDASTTFSGHSGPGAEVDAVALDPDFFTRKLGRAAGFANMCVRPCRSQTLEATLD